MAIELVQRRASLLSVGEESRLNSVLDASSEGIFSLDEQGTIEKLNPAAERMFGYVADEVIGHLFSQLMAAIDRERFDEYFQATTAELDEVYDNPREFTCRHKQGVTFPVRLALSEFHSGHRRCFTAITQDLSEQRTAQQRALQSERLAAIGQTVASLSHETRNALQLSQASLDLLSLEVEDQPRAIALVGRVQAAQHRITRLFEELREFAAPVTLDCEPCDLGRLFIQVLDEVASIHSPREVRLVQRSDGTSMNCRVDSFHIHQVFRNLLDNAVEASPDPVLIQVTWSECQLDLGPAVAISIRNGGPGLSANQRRRVFDPFFTTKKSGTGLGLSIARQIVNAHGGTLAVGDRMDGAEFVISLPTR